MRDGVYLGCRLRVEVEIELSGQWMWTWAEYDNMTIESESNNYRLHVTGYHGNAGDAFNFDEDKFRSNGMMFSSPEVDNDMSVKENCALNKAAGWWFRMCSRSILNGRVSRWYPYPPSAVGASRMMLQCDAVASGDESLTERETSWNDPNMP